MLRNIGIGAVWALFFVSGYIAGRLAGIRRIERLKERIIFIRLAAQYKEAGEEETLHPGDAQSIAQGNREGG